MLIIPQSFPLSRCPKLSSYIVVCRATRAAQETETAGNVHASHQGWTFKESQDQTPASLPPPVQMNIFKNPGDVTQCQTFSCVFSAVWDDVRVVLR